MMQIRENICIYSFYKYYAVILMLLFRNLKNI